ncbi:hypothetical protein X777_04040 [Ooceraea biroi]|uniref:DUF4218 domain-containing protein n=1 Tax=Ooceraea biroi TaxID=2015173 RepID=A0A026WJ16_OOCBI|nr:hypothetical protein X777_04040 [Ooceraea biroi]
MLSKLPQDARTLLSTPLQYVVKTIEPGEYIHFGLCNGIKRSIEEQTLITTTIQVAINIDGLPLSKSSVNSFWPILGSILPHRNVFIIGVYYGKEKPKNVNDFLYETIDLYANGISINNSKYLFKVKYCVRDAPAKSYILQCRRHTGYYSCTKCTVEGTYKQNRICFPEINALKRITNEDFRMQTDDSYHTYITYLKKFPILILYTGPIVLKSILSQDIINNHFISLHVAIRILCNENIKTAYMEYAKTLLKHFIESFGTLYGKHHISHNIHSLCHLTEDVNNFGILDNFTTYVTTEFKKTSKKLYPIKSTYHCNGPLLSLSSSPQYKSVECMSFKVDANSKANDCCELQDNTILLLRNIAYCTESKELVIIGNQFECKENYYNTPCDSSVLDIQGVSGLSVLI